MKNSNFLPSATQIAPILRSLRDALEEHDGWVDVRLCVEKAGDWVVRDGDVSFDTYHSDYVGAGTVEAGEPDSAMLSLAEDLLEQVKDEMSVAEDHDIPEEYHYVGSEEDDTWTWDKDLEDEALALAATWRP